MSIAIDRVTRIMNTLVKSLSHMGISAFGAQELVVRGRVSGKEFSTPVNPVTVDGCTYLVAPRGQTQWVRNARHHGEVAMRLGRTRTPYDITEVCGVDAVPVMRHYLRKWAWEVGRFFPEGVTARSTDAELEAIIPAHPVFRITRQAA
ncbi:nitroreductase family deazaflavin-dependent oxidoreductase [Calidifontibacter sp. DB0510]|uniref:Nitroreductase family deazaflavin-dependent oxidoreductase n=1 Tax=Metallococcus carri TaxID=1656884 RepID=A0A967B125_9MICO|nr:nitroreductase/quinone reductase family protein [Metallococcus carri]NHN56841.1 nitroreductase family deazaflavin-dependent oxidoreductase [Metallococcus carri]NOP37782.1 nitroreductase family deazaflavin-dependent oxidoreductase [Calidifontibacter sp. DB2511S]